jgi:O-antigen/teichoic acid export membrane protein
MSATENLAAAEPAAFPGASPVQEVVVDRPPNAPPDRTAPDHLERSVGVGVVWKLVGQAGVQGVRLVTVAILARLLTPGDYGVAAIAIALATFAPTVADMGMGAALVQTERATRVVRSTVFWASVAFGVAFSVLAAVSAGPVGRFLDDPRVGTIVAVGGLTFAICSLGSTSQAVFIRDMKFRSIELRFWFALLVASGLSVTAASLGAGAWALVLQQVALLATFAVALWWRAGWHPTFEFSGVVFRQLGSFAVRVAGGRWARLAELLVLSLLIGKLVGVSSLGAWSFAMSTVILPLTVIAIPIAEVLFSAFSRLRDDRERMAALWLESNRLLAAVILPVLVGLMVVAPDLIPTVFGSHWHVSVGIIQILSVYVIVRSLQAWSSVLLDAVGRPQLTLWTQLVALCLTPVAVVVGSQWSVEAVAGCYVAGQLIAVEIPILVLVLSELRISPTTLARRLFGVAAATLLMGTASLLARTGLATLEVGMVERAAATIVVGLLVYVAVLSWLAPDICRRALAFARRLLGKVAVARRERAVET